MPWISTTSGSTSSLKLVASSSRVSLCRRFSWRRIALVRSMSVPMYIIASRITRSEKLSLLELLP